MGRTRIVVWRGLTYLLLNVWRYFICCDYSLVVCNQFGIHLADHLVFQEVSCYSFYFFCSAEATEVCSVYSCFYLCSSLFFYWCSFLFCLLMLLLVFFLIASTCAFTGVLPYFCFIFVPFSFWGLSFFFLFLLDK